MALACNPKVNGKEYRALSAKKFELNCLRDREMDVSVPALVGGVAECMDGL